MQDDERLTPIELELEAALSGLKPAGAAANRDRVMFLAGRASVCRRNRLWQGTCVFLAAALVASFVARPKPDAVPTHRDPAVNVNREVHSLSLASGPASDVDSARVEALREYVRLRRAVLEQGVDALPASIVSPKDASDSSAPYERLTKFLSAT
jgi:hypothetical protein